MIQSNDKTKTEISVRPGYVRTQRELADVMGLDCSSSISQYVKRGMPSEAEGGFDIKKCLDWRQANINGASQVDDQYKFFRAAHEREKFLIAKLKRESVEGALVSSSSVDTRVAMIFLPVIKAAQELSIILDDLDFDGQMDPTTARIASAAINLTKIVSIQTCQLKIT